MAVAWVYSKSFCFQKKTGAKSIFVSTKRYVIGGKKFYKRLKVLILLNGFAIFHMLAVFMRVVNTYSHGIGFIGIHAMPNILNVKLQNVIFFEEECTLLRFMSIRNYIIWAKAFFWKIVKHNLEKLIARG